MRAGAICLALVACLGSAVVHAAPVPVDATPWDACDHLDPAAGFGGASGWRLEAEALSRETVSGELESALRAGREPARGFGFAAAWRRAWNERAGSADDVAAWIVRRGARHRIAVGSGRLAFAGEGQGRALLDVRVQPFAPVLAGARASVYPGEGVGATEVVYALHGGLGAWWGGLELGPRAGDLRVALGLCAGPGVAWTVAYAGSAPALGIVLRRRGFELHAEEAAHPLLGRVSRVRLVLGGGER